MTGSLPQLTFLPIPTPLLTVEEIEACRTPRGGYTRAQLEAWAVEWPPQRGWKRKLTTRTTERPWSRSQRARTLLLLEIALSLEDDDRTELCRRLKENDWEDLWAYIRARLEATS